MNKLDTRVRRVTRPGANWFAELGFAPAEALLYQEQMAAVISQVLAEEQLAGHAALSSDEEGSRGPQAYLPIPPATIANPRASGETARAACYKKFLKIC